MNGDPLDDDDIVAPHEYEIDKYWNGEAIAYVVTFRGNGEIARLFLTQTSMVEIGRTFLEAASIPLISPN